MYILKRKLFISIPADPFNKNHLMYNGPPKKGLKNLNEKERALNNRRTPGTSITTT